ncbi:MAG: hypothetical protein A3G25_14880 [Betaproteobacteria bacterium RIFCSPLOWO2_12_FULL_63_13]|nr:MAG: hypothetical protein A3G25_14880 [Betaproteobacteria bacterium RIFCSPLOWO2_12_FULL_63_13]
MPVRKYRSIYEMPDETWREPGDPLLYRAIREVWDFGRRTSGRRYRPGVYRFRSIEEMDVAQSDWGRATAAGDGCEPQRP